jgi:hypothetical protein
MTWGSTRHLQASVKPSYPNPHPATSLTCSNSGCSLAQGRRPSTGLTRSLAGEDVAYGVGELAVYLDDNVDERLHFVLQ